MLSESWASSYEPHTCSSGEACGKTGLAGLYLKSVLFKGLYILMVINNRQSFLSPHLEEKMKSRVLFLLLLSS